MCEYRLPFTANIDRLKSGISIAPSAQISSAQRAHISSAIFSFQLFGKIIFRLKYPFLTKTDIVPPYFSVRYFMLFTP